MSLVDTPRPWVWVEGGAALFRGGWVGLGTLCFTPHSAGGTQKGSGGQHCAEGPPQGRLRCWGRSFPSALLGSAPSSARWPHARACVLPAPQPAGRGMAPPGPQPIGVGAPLTFPLPAVWLTTQNHSTLVTERSAVPFLPVNPEYSATRNQVSPVRCSDPSSHSDPPPPHCFYLPCHPRAGRSWPGSTPGSLPLCSSIFWGKPSAGSRARARSAPRVRMGAAGVKVGEGGNTPHPQLSLLALQRPSTIH